MSRSLSSKFTKRWGKKRARRSKLVTGAGPIRGWHVQQWMTDQRHTITSHSCISLHIYNPLIWLVRNGNASDYVSSGRRKKKKEKKKRISICNGLGLGVICRKQSKFKSFLVYRSVRAGRLVPSYILQYVSARNTNKQGCGVVKNI